MKLMTIFELAAKPESELRALTVRPSTPQRPGKPETLQCPTGQYPSRHALKGVEPLRSATTTADYGLIGPAPGQKPQGPCLSCRVTPLDRFNPGMVDEAQSTLG